MPKQVVRNLIKKDLTKDEREEFMSVGFSDDEIKKINTRLKAEHWFFWSKSAGLHLSLASDEGIRLQDGKAIASAVTMSIHFEHNIADTGRREVAKNVFLSDAYREQRVMEVEAHSKEEAEKQYQKFRTAVMSTKENLTRLKKDIAEIEASA